MRQSCRFVDETYILAVGGLLAVFLPAVLARWLPEGMETSPPWWGGDVRGACLLRGGARQGGRYGCDSLGPPAAPYPWVGQHPWDGPPRES